MKNDRLPFSGVRLGIAAMVVVVSTSHPDGNGANEKNCTRLYREKPTHGSGRRGSFSDYIGRFFLHFTIKLNLIKSFALQSKYIFQTQGHFFCI